MPHDHFPPRQRVIGRAAAWAVSLLGAVYAVTTALGFFSLSSPDDPIGDPYFTFMEILILIMAPLMVVTMAAVHAYAVSAAKLPALVALAFMTILAGLTSSVHAVILTVGDTVAVSGSPWGPLLVSFSWPSVVYALDILAWDWFFALAILCAVPAFGGRGLEAKLRALMIVCGVLSLAGLIGVPLGDMRFRNIGIVGYGLIAPIVFFLIGAVFGQTEGS